MSYACEFSESYTLFFPLEEKNLLNPLDCFSGGVVADEDDEDTDKEGPCFDCLEFTGGVARMSVSALDGLHGELRRSGFDESTPSITL